MPVEPKYHTAEHLVTASIEHLYDGYVIDTRFKGKKVRCDYKIELNDNSLEDAINKVEKKANEIVNADLPITIDTITREEAEQQMALRKVPTDMDPIRLVKIGDFDITPCSGEHVRSTSYVGLIEIRTFNPMEDNIIRLTFMLR